MSGEATVRWPDTTSVIKTGEGSPGQPPHTPMFAASTGDGTLKELTMFVVDPPQDFASPAKMDEEFLKSLTRNARAAATEPPPYTAWVRLHSGHTSVSAGRIFYVSP